MIILQNPERGRSHNRRSSYFPLEREAGTTPRRRRSRRRHSEIKSQRLEESKGLSFFFFLLLHNYFVLAISRDQRLSLFRVHPTSQPRSEAISQVVWTRKDWDLAKSEEGGFSKFII
jgi:hypothetical protein